MRTIFTGLISFKIKLPTFSIIWSLFIMILKKLFHALLRSVPGAEVVIIGILYSR